MKSIYQSYFGQKYFANLLKLFCYFDKYLTDYIIVKCPTYKMEPPPKTPKTPDPVQTFEGVTGELYIEQSQARPQSRQNTDRYFLQNTRMALESRGIEKSTLEGLGSGSEDEEDYEDTGMLNPIEGPQTPQNTLKKESDPYPVSVPVLDQNQKRAKDSAEESDQTSSDSSTEDSSNNNDKEDDSYIFKQKLMELKKFNCPQISGKNSVNASTSPAISPRQNIFRGSIGPTCDDRNKCPQHIIQMELEALEQLQGSGFGDFFDQNDNLIKCNGQGQRARNGFHDSNSTSSDEEYTYFPRSAYNPAEYENLNVPPEIKELFQYISKYAPAPFNTQVKLKPFIPEYYPSVGDIDAFIKVPHPWTENDGLGIRCLDEPSAFQSDPSVLDLRLRALAKKSSAKAVVIKKVENASKNGKVIENWIKDISDLHLSKPSPSVHYSKPMPDIDTLMQEWPADFEDLLKRVNLPRPDIECDLATYVDIICNLLDIPVNRSRIQSLHLLASLYSASRQYSQLGLADNSRDGGLNEADLMPSSTSLRIDAGGDYDDVDL